MTAALERAHDPEGAPNLRLYLFGQMEVVGSGGLVPRLPSRRATWLLAILVLRKGRPIERQSLAGLLWPDSSDEGALHNLRQTLAGLRRALGPSAESIVNVSPRSILLRQTESNWADVLEFDGAIADGSLGALERAIELYRGPLLAGCQEPFAVDEREIRERAFLAATERLAAHYVSRQNLARATDVLRRAVAVDPYRESAFRALMASLSESGEGAAALDLYRTLRQRLRNDLNADPDPETVQLYRSIRSKLNVRIDQPPPKPGQAQRIPVPLNPLLGRQSEVGEVSSLVDRCRLVTLTGVAGVGKTRLAIAVAQAIGDNFLDGARFVDLAPLQDPGSVGSAIAASLDIPEHVGRPLLDTLAENLRGRDVLLVLDNCEHLASGVAGAVEVLLSASPGLHVLATSRQSVGVSGELVWRVPSLAIPAPISSATWKETRSTDRADYLRQTDSVRLFLERSNQMGADTLTSASELEAIGSICRRLDGIPLAIELAASRTNVLSAPEIEGRLEDRFSLLAGGSTSLARHQTMRAAIEWSWDLLTDAERRLMMSLCVFRGGCTLEAIEAVFLGTDESKSVLDLLSSLVDRSLITTSRNEEGSRFSMLESIRQFAMDRLKQSKDWAIAFDRHLDFFMKWATAAHPKQSGREQNVWFKRLEMDHDNMRAALDWCYAREDWVKGLQLAALLGRFWDTHGHLSEGRGRLEALLERAEATAPPELVAGARVQAGWAATVQRDSDAARTHFQKAMAYAQEVADEAAIAGTLNMLACVATYAGDFQSAQQQYEGALEIYRRLREPNLVAMVLNNMAENALLAEDPHSARAYLEQIVAEGGELSTDSPERSGLTLGNFAITDFRLGRFDEARARALESLRMLKSGDVVVSVPAALDLVAVVSTPFEEWDKVAHLLGASGALAALQGVPVLESLERDRTAAMSAARSAMGTEAFASAFAEGQQMTMEESIAYALLEDENGSPGDPG